MVNDQEPAVETWRALIDRVDAMEERDKRLDELTKMFDDAERALIDMVNRYFN